MKYRKTPLFVPTFNLKIPLSFNIKDGYYLADILQNQMTIITQC